MERFIINSDGTVTDTAMGLMWDQKTQDPMKWNDARAFCKSLTTAGYTDWRLPTIEELSSIVDYKRCEPAIDTNTFPGTRLRGYWSSSTNVSNPEYAWHVNFYYGLVDIFHKSFGYYVRAVRTIKGGETKQRSTANCVDRFIATGDIPIKTIEGE